MADLLHRYTPDLEVRADGAGRTVFGLLVPFGATTEVDDGRGSYSERFVPGAFARSIRERGDRVKLLLNHNARALPVGKFTQLREDAAGLFGEARVSATGQGDEALELVRDGVLDAFSVGFRPIRHRRASDGATERTEVALREASLVAFPAYEGALVAGVRSAFNPELDRERWRHRLTLITKDY